MTMPDRMIEASPSTSVGGRAPVEASAGAAGRVGWLAPVVLMDYVAAFLAFVAAGGYLILKVIDDGHSVLYPVLDQIARWFLYLEIHEMPGLPDYPSLRHFADADFALIYIIAMTALHLLAAAGFLALAGGLNRFRPWARRTHIAIASLIILILGAYAFLYARSTAPGIGLAVMAAAAIVPAAVLAILLTPAIAALFAEGPRPDGAMAPRPYSRGTRLPRLLIGAFLAVYVLGVLLAAFVVSVPVAIDLKMILAPPA